jgi:hypothetical protein
MIIFKNMLNVRWLFILGLGMLLNVQSYAQETNCGDRIDNDTSGLVDCFDPGCDCYICDNKQDNYWFLGDGVALDFNTITQYRPTLSYGNISLNAYEGCASISDPNGNFIFATDGRTIEGLKPSFWQPSPLIVDYNGITLKGGESSTHAAVVVPKPTAQNEYYIFTSGAQNQNQYGINATKLTFLNTSPSPSPRLEAKLSLPANNSLIAVGQSTEKLAVARHDNCRDYWLVTHDFGSSPIDPTNNGKNYIAYKVNGSW